MEKGRKEMWRIVYEDNEAYKFVAQLLIKDKIEDIEDFF